MKIEAEQVLSRFHLSSLARHGDQTLYQWIVETARREDLQGATVLKGILGLRADGTLLRERNWTISQEVPVVVEVVDGPKHIGRLLQKVEPVFRDGVITLERARIALYRSGAERTDVARCDVVAGKATRRAWEVETVKIPEDGVLLRVFIGESDREPGGGRPLYQAIVQRAREAQLAGATVLKGPMGFGRHSRMHSAQLLEMSTDLPILIELVDAEDKIQAFLPVVDELVTEGLVTLEAVRVLKYVSPEGAR